VSRSLLDTTALIDFSKGREPARTRILDLIAGGDELAICAVNLAEFYAGIRVGDAPAMDAFFAVLSYWEISRAAARQAGAWRHDLARQGVALSTSDALIAAVALEHDAVLLTDNAKDYPLPGLRLASLRD